MPNKKIASSCRSVGLVAMVLVMTAAAHGAVRVGDTPKLNFKTIDNQAVTSETLEGRIVVLDFWATWCGPCVKEIPHMIAVNRKYASQGVRIVGISLDARRSDDTRFVKVRKMNWTHVCDGKVWKGSMVRQFGVRSIPRIFILSPEGKVLWTGHPARIDKPLADAFKNHPPVPPESSASAKRAEALAKLKQARGAITADNDYDRALTLLAEVPEEDLCDPRVSVYARNLATKLDVPEASEALGAHPAIARKLGAIKAGLHVAKAKLGAADKAHAQGNHPMAYRLYVAVAQRAAATELGDTAARQAADYEADEQVQPRLKNVKIDHQTTALLAIAQHHQEAGRIELARQRFEQVVNGDPDSPQAAEASQALEALTADD